LVDGDRIAARLARLEHLLEQLEEIHARGEEAYRSDESLRLRAERALQLALQICLDVGAHLVSELGLEAPADYRGVFTSLRKGGLLDDDLATRLEDAAGLRSVLVHGYLDVDDRRVWQALGQLDDLRAFAAAALKAVEP